MACNFGFPMVASKRLDDCADTAMDWLAKDQEFREKHGGRKKADYWRNQWQLHTAMIARIESRHGHLFMPNAHALAEERSDDSQQRVVGGKVDR